MSTLRGDHSNQSGFEASQTLNRWLSSWLSPEKERPLLRAGAGLILGAVIAALAFEQPLIAGVPFAILGAAIWLLDFRPYYFLILLSTPLSMEFAVSPSLATDLPTEPLMLLLTGTFFARLILKRHEIPWERFRHPLATWVFLALLWSVVTVVFSVDRTVSGKWLLAKVWYVFAFGGVTLLVMKTARDFRAIFWCLFVPTLFTVVWTLVKHASFNFGFAQVNLSMEPWYRNHVNYAVFLALVYPFLWLAASWYRKWSWQRMLLNTSKVLFGAAIYFSYTRSSWVSLVVAAAAFIVMSRHLLKPATILALVCLFGTCAWLLNDNKYLDYAPDFSKTIYHDDFGDHMAATTSLEDVSSAERIYRWVAGWYMFEDKPITGFGPGNFYPWYQFYTVSSFYTYISRNEERSTVHNYYILLLLEQGFLGCFLFFCLITTAVFRGQSIYSRARDPETKRLAMAVTLSFITILVNLFFSDLLEADKIGTLFFLLLAVLIVLDLNSRKALSVSKEES